MELETYDTTPGKNISIKKPIQNRVKGVMQVITKGCYVTSIDLKDAYHSVKIDPSVSVLFKI